MGCCVSNCCIRLLGGEWRDEKQMWQKETGLSKAALNLVDDAFKDINPEKILDVHVHLLGIKEDESGCYLHDNMDDCCKCQSFIKKRVMLQASGNSNIDNPDKDIEYVYRLVSLFEQFIPTYLQNDIIKAKNKNKNKNKNNDKNQKNETKESKENEENNNDSNKSDSENGNDEKTQLNTRKKSGDNKKQYDTDQKLAVDSDESATDIDSSRSKQGVITPRAVLLGLDQVYNKETGAAERDHTSVHTPHRYVNQIVNEYPNLFALGPSIHPYRPNCTDLLKLYHGKGCKIIKWLPNSMGIDPNDSKCDAFYDTMKELDMILLTHTGAEHSLDDANYTFNEYGNPLKLRRALDKGVKVIMAHCASEGSDVDTDISIENEKTNNSNGEQVTSVDLFLRLMKEDRYKGLLFGDISAITAFRRVSACLKILKATDIHDRLIYGSDYPVPCLNMAVWYQKLANSNMINNSDLGPLREIFNYNPLLADFVLKRIMTIHDDNGKVCKFSDKIFQRADLVDPKWMAQDLAAAQKSDDATELKVDQKDLATKKNE